MLTAVVSRGAHLEVQLFFTAAGEEEESTVECEFPLEAGVVSEEPCETGPSPIAPEAKEIAWGAGSFIVLALLMRFLLYPRLKKGMDARYGLIRDGHEQADTSRAAARAEVAEYESALATVKSEANERIEAARQTLEAERTARLVEVNESITVRREAAAAAAQAARDAVDQDVAAAVADVTSRTVELSIGRAPDQGVVRSAVDQVMGAGVSS